MGRLTFHSRSGEDSALRGKSPRRLYEFRVKALLETEKNRAPRKKKQTPLWKGNPPRNAAGQTWKEFIEATGGAWQGEFPPRDQGEYPVREEIA